jgi:hypothetical protein
LSLYHSHVRLRYKNVCLLIPSFSITHSRFLPFSFPPAPPSAVRLSTYSILISASYSPRSPQFISTFSVQIFSGCLPSYPSPYLNSSSTPSLATTLFSIIPSLLPPLHCTPFPFTALSHSLDSCHPLRLHCSLLVVNPHLLTIAAATIT